MSRVTSSGATTGRLSIPLYSSVRPLMLDLGVSAAWMAPVAVHEALRAERASRGAPLYTPEQKKIRDTTPWTLVQGVLAPLQFLVFLVSLALVVRFLVTGDGLALATGSVVAKTLVLYVIMVTGAIWEKVVFGRYLFAPAFFWEDAVSMVVIALHTAYLGLLLSGTGSPHLQMGVALAAYFTYVINAAQFILKLRAARLHSAHATHAGAA
jgi:3-vinyl bacteriochlorophyllide hydratase